MKKNYYLDETWINAGHIKPKIWVDKTIKSSKQAFMDGLSTGLKNPSGIFLLPQCVNNYCNFKLITKLSFTLVVKKNLFKFI